VVGCQCGYLLGEWCRFFACSPADATAIPKPHHLLRHYNPDWFYLSGTGLPTLSWRIGQQQQQQQYIAQKLIVPSRVEGSAVGKMES